MIKLSNWLSSRNADSISQYSSLSLYRIGQCLFFHSIFASSWYAVITPGVLIYNPLSTTNFQNPDSLLTRSVILKYNMSLSLKSDIRTNPVPSWSREQLKVLSFLPRGFHHIKISSSIICNIFLIILCIIN